MNNKIISIKTKDVAWLMDQLKQSGKLKENAFSPEVIRSLMDLFFSFEDGAESITQTNVYLELYDITKLMSFIDSHGSGLEAILLLGEAINSKPQVFYRKSYSSKIASEVKNSFIDSKDVPYKTGLVLFYNILRRTVLNKDLELETFARKMYIQIDKEIDKEIAEKGLDINIMRRLTSFISFFRDEEYVPLIFINHWKEFVDFIDEEGLNSFHTTEFVSVLTDLLFQTNRAFTKELFQEVSNYILVKIKDSITTTNFMLNQYDSQDGVLLMGYLYIILCPRNEMEDFKNVFSNVTGYLSEYSDDMTEATRRSLSALREINDPLISNIRNSPDKNNPSSCWSYPLICNRLQELGKTNNSPSLKFVTILKHSLQFSVYYQQFLLLIMYKNGMNKLAVNEDGNIDFKKSQSDSFKEEQLAALKFFPSSPLAKINTLQYLPDTIVNIEVDDKKKLFLFVLEKIISNGLAVDIDQLAQMDQPYLDITNQYISEALNKLTFNKTRLPFFLELLNHQISDKNMKKQIISIIIGNIGKINSGELSKLLDQFTQIKLPASDTINQYLTDVLKSLTFNKTNIPFLYELLNHSISDMEMKKQIIEIIVRVIGKDYVENLTIALETFYLSNDLNQLSEVDLKKLQTAIKNKPNNKLRELTDHLAEIKQTEFIANIWATVNSRIVSIEGVLKTRKEEAIKEALRKIEAEEAKKVEVERQAEAEKQLQAFKEVLQKIKGILDLPISEQAQIDSLSKEIDNLATTNIEATLNLEEKIAKLEMLITEIRKYFPKLQSIKDEAEELALMALEAGESYVEPTEENMQSAVPEILGHNYQQVTTTLDIKAKQSEAIADQIGSLEQTANKHIGALQQNIQSVRQQIRDERLSQAQEVRRIQQEAEVQKQKEADKVLDEEIKRLEEIEAAEIAETSQIILRFVAQRMSQKPEGDIISELDKELATLKNDFNIAFVENVTITPDEYEGPLKGILKSIQMKRKNSKTYINFGFNNYSLIGELDAKGALTLESIPTQLANNHMLLQSILNKIALTLIIGKDKTSEFSLKHPASAEGIIITEKSKAYRLNSSTMLFKQNEYLLSADGNAIVEDKDAQRELLLSADYFIRENRDTATVLIPIIAKDREALKSELRTAIEMYGSENIVHILMRTNHRRRLTTKVEIPSTINVEDTEVKLQKNDSVVSEATIYRYLANYQGLTDSESQQKYISEIVMGDRKDPYLLKDDEHPIGVSFGHTQVLKNRVAYTFVRDSVSLVSLGN